MGATTEDDEMRLPSALLCLSRKQKLAIQVILVALEYQRIKFILKAQVRIMHMHSLQQYLPKCHNKFGPGTEYGRR